MYLKKGRAFQAYGIEDQIDSAWTARFGSIAAATVMTYRGAHEHRRQHGPLHRYGESGGYRLRNLEASGRASACATSAGLSSLTSSTWNRRGRRESVAGAGTRVNHDRTHAYSGHQPGLTENTHEGAPRHRRRLLQDVQASTAAPSPEPPLPTRCREIWRVRATNGRRSSWLAIRRCGGHHRSGQTCAGWREIGKTVFVRGTMASTFRTCGSWRWARGGKWSASRPAPEGSARHSRRRAPCSILRHRPCQDACSTSKEPVSTSVRSCKSKSHGFSARTKAAW